MNRIQGLQNAGRSARYRVHRCELWLVTVVFSQCHCHLGHEASHQLVPMALGQILSVACNAYYPVVGSWRSSGAPGSRKTRS